jgi:hypothetical protein
MLAIILGFLTGLAGPISTLVGKVADLKTEQLKASTDKEKAQIQQEIEEVHDKKAVLVAEAGNRIAAAINASIRLALAIGPMLYILKYYAWDKVIGSWYGCSGNFPTKTMEQCATFSTDPLSLQMAGVMTAVIGFYFLTATIRKNG